MTKQDEFQPADISWEDLDKKTAGVSWFWKGWIPNGQVTLLVGDVESGKSATALDIVGSVTDDGQMEDGQVIVTGKAVWVDTEDHAAENLDRAKAWGLDLSKIRHIDNFDVFNARSLELLEKMMADPEVRICVVDSFGGAIHDDTKPEASKFIRDLVGIASRTGKAVVVIHHPRKRSLQFEERGVITLDRVRGTSRLVQFARSVLAIDRPDQTLPDVHRFRAIKLNGGMKSKPLGFEVRQRNSDPEHFDLLWTTAPGVKRQGNKITAAIAILTTALALGPVPISQLKTLAKGSRTPWRSFQRARVIMLVTLVRVPEGDKSVWAWSLPPLKSPGQVGI